MKCALWKALMSSKRTGMAEGFMEAQQRAARSIEAGLCGCWRCIGERNEARLRMILCPTCGCKRCPKASDHNLACTGSNEPGQLGSVYA